MSDALVRALGPAALRQRGAADRAGVVALEPLRDALDVEDVPLVAGQAYLCSNFFATYSQTLRGPFSDLSMPIFVCRVLRKLSSFP